MERLKACFFHSRRGKLFRVIQELRNFVSNLYQLFVRVEAAKYDFSWGEMKSVMGKFNLFMPLYSINYALLDPIVSV